MGWGKIPINPENRKTILVLKKVDVERCKYEDNASDLLLDDEVYVLSFPIEESTNKPLFLQNIKENQLITPGTLLIQNPFDPESYQELSKAAESFALEKHLHFSNLCKLLGAKKVCVKETNIKIKNEKMRLDLNGKYKITDVQAECENERLDRLRSSLCMVDEFHGGSPDIGSAENFLRTKGLIHDPAMKNLLELRQGDNYLKARTLTVDLFKEAQHNFKAAGKIDIPIFLNFSTDYLKELDTQYSFSVEINIQF